MPPPYKLEGFSEINNDIDVIKEALDKGEDNKNDQTDDNENQEVTFDIILDNLIQFCDWLRNLKYHIPEHLRKPPENENEDDKRKRQIDEENYSRWGVRFTFLINQVGQGLYLAMCAIRDYFTKERRKVLNDLNTLNPLH